MGVTAASLAGIALADRRRFRLFAAAAVALLIAATVAALAIGAVALSPREVAASLIGTAADERHAAIVQQLRLPRLLVAGLVGAALATAGALMQGLFRNPLADPGLIGVSAGATLAAATTIVASGWLFPADWQPVMLPVGAFVGGLAVIGLIYRIARVDGVTVVPMLLLAGIAFNAIAMSLTGFLIFVADDMQLRDITFWMLGSVGGAQWSTVTMLAPFALLPMLAIPWLARALDALNLGEREAAHLGFRVETVKRVACLGTAMAVGAAVAVSGTIAFVGLVVPHVIRLACGPRHARLLPLAAISGAALLIGADVAARTLVAPAELPIGLITALIGAPFFLALLLHVRRSFVG